MEIVARSSETSRIWRHVLGYKRKQIFTDLFSSAFERSSMDFLLSRKPLDTGDMVSGFSTLVTAIQEVDTV